MTGDELERTIKFLLDQQATFFAGLEEMKAESRASRLESEKRLLSEREVYGTTLRHALELIAKIAEAGSETKRDIEQQLKQISANIDRLERNQERIQIEAEQDRRIMREMLQEMKDNAHRIEGKTDRNTQRLNDHDRRLARIESPAAGE